VISAGSLSPLPMSNAEPEIFTAPALVNPRVAFRLWASVIVTKKKEKMMKMKRKKNEKWKKKKKWKKKLKKKLKKIKKKNKKKIKMKMKMKMKMSWSWLKLLTMSIKDDHNWVGWVRNWKRREKLTFFSLFHLFRQFPLKSSNPKCSRYTHPPTVNITPLCSPHDTLHGGGGFVEIAWVW